MADSVGSGFPSTGINKGHVFYDFDESSMWLYLGGIPRLASSWVLLYGRLTSQPDTSLWGSAQAGAMWYNLSDGQYYGWNGSAIVILVSGSNPSLYDYRSTIKLQDDFYGGTENLSNIGQLGWVATNGTMSTLGGETNHIGQYRRDTSAVISTYAVLQLVNNTPGLKVNANHTQTFIIRLNNNDANTTMRIGVCHLTTSNPPGEGIYFEKLDGDTNWFGVCRTGAVQTRIDLGIVIDTNYHSFSYTRSSAGVQFSIDGIAVGSVIATNLPTSATTCVGIINSAAVSKTFDIDYWELILTGITR